MNIEDMYMLSPMQEGMLFHSLYAPTSGLYFQQIAYNLNSRLDVSTYERAWQLVVDRHPILRTAFVWEELEHPLQIVYRHVKMLVMYHDWHQISPAEQRRHLSEFIQADRQYGFDFSRPPLMRLHLIKLNENKFQAIWSFHHMLLDAWSYQLVLNGVESAYNALSTGSLVQHDEVRPYRDYILWLQQQDLDMAEHFWRQMLRGFISPTPLPAVTVHRPNANVVTEYVQKHVILSESTTNALLALARQKQVTINTLMQGTWAIILSRYSGATDIVFGAVVSGRPPEIDGIENMVGLFINTLPVRVKVPATVQMLPWLKDLQVQQADSRQYEYTPLVRIQEWSDMPRGVPLFESILVYKNVPSQVLTDESCYEKELVTIDSEIVERTNYPLSLVAIPGKRLRIRCIYDMDLFEEATIQRLLGHFETLLTAMATKPECTLDQLPLLTEVERQQLLVEWNATERTYPQDRCLHELFGEQVERTPDAVAVVFEEQQLTYADLNRRANQLAHYLRGAGVGPEVLVGICVERSVEMVIGLLGILKAGGAYVPLDPSYPKERLTFMLQDAQPGVVLTQQRLDEGLMGQSVPLLCIDSSWEPIAQEPIVNPARIVQPENLAYAIYTSGSTGQPKGSMITHGSLVNFCSSMTLDTGLTAQDVFLAVTTLAFDIAALELFVPLLVGARVVLASRVIASDAFMLKEVLDSCEVTAMQATPATWRLLLEEEWHSREHLKILCGGEALPRDLAAQLLKRSTNLWNLYGPTETTVWSSLYEIESEESLTSIGRPIANTQIYLLDAQLQPVPIGVAGELYIGGIGLARGYWHRPDLTAERFLPNPFGQDHGGRLYRTGDLACYWPDGTIECLGRLDTQVKLRGYRIELGEIEATLRVHPAVREAVVGVAGATPESKRLLAYLALEPMLTPGPTHTELRSFLQECLPEYMLPASFILLEMLPLTPNGKLDRLALSRLDAPQLELAESFVAPRTPIEEALADIWRQLLGHEQIGVHDNFFELGGHSLLAMQFTSRVRLTLQVELPLRMLFESPTIAELSTQIIKARQSKSGVLQSPLVSSAHNGEVLLSFTQERLWFLDRLDQDNATYNILIHLQLRGSLHLKSLEQSLTKIVERHEVLRTAFVNRNGSPVQVIAPPSSPVFLPIVDLTVICEEKRKAAVADLVAQEARLPFDLAQSPLLRVLLVQVASEEHLLLLSMHHIISDGWSVDILLHEFFRLYHGFATQQSVQLPALPIQYADYALWQREWLQGDVLEDLLSYWKEHLAGAPPLLELPTDHPRPATQSFRGASLSFHLSKDLSQALKTLSRQQGVTLFMTLLAAFQVLLARYSGQEDIVVGTPIANRNRAEVEGLIGFFMNTLVLRTDLSGNPAFGELLGRVREVALGAYDHQDMPFEKLVEALQPDRDLSRNPLFQVMFILQNTSRRSLEKPETLGLQVSFLQTENTTAKFDLTLSLWETPRGLGGEWEYNTDLFDAGTLERMTGHFQQLLQGIVLDPEQHLAALPLLTQAERQQLLVEWNATERTYPQDRCLHELFEEQVARTPDAVAVVFEEQQLTYADLNRRANQLAHYLQGLGIGPEGLVGICVERCLEMVVGLLGILKAGGAYVPLDPTYPKERLAFMVADSQVAIVLTHQFLQGNLLAVSGVQMISLDTDWKIIVAERHVNPHRGVVSDNLAYVIYTSGSTGWPKGTLVTHRNVTNFFTGMDQRLGKDMPGIWLAVTSISFDISVLELFWTLTRGFQVVVYETSGLLGTLSTYLATVERLKEMDVDEVACLVDFGIDEDAVLGSLHELDKLRQYSNTNKPVETISGQIRRLGITHLQCTPSLADMVVLEPEALSALGSLQKLLLGGEALPVSLAKQLGEVVGGAIHNMYGPTETTIWSTTHTVEHKATTMAIGRPIANTQVYILDRWLQTVPVGVAGELYIGGVGVARGYLNQSKLTAERFVPNPFSITPGMRLYRTGDLVRYSPEGNLEFLGRFDAQVKLRGFRIELEEIETVLEQHPMVREAVVVIRETEVNAKQLVAYLVFQQGETPSQTALRSFVQQRLPEYMVPAIFVSLEILPLTPNGKRDRRALPIPNQIRSELNVAYVAPQTPVEEMLADIWIQVLGVKAVGIHDNFFTLGGHSLLATQVVSRIQTTFQMGLSLRQFFESPTIGDLAALIINQERTAYLQANVKTLPESEVESLLYKLLIEEGIEYE